MMTAQEENPKNEKDLKKNNKHKKYVKGYSKLT